MPSWKHAVAALWMAAALAPGASSQAQAATDIDLFFPVPVQGKLSAELQRLVGEFNRTHPDIRATAVYTQGHSVLIIWSQMGTACRNRDYPREAFC